MFTSRIETLAIFISIHATLKDMENLEAENQSKLDLECTY